MHKNILLVVGITILFLGNCITPMTLGYNVKIFANGWYIYTVDEEDFESYSSLALDSNNYPHIIGTSNGKFVQYARWNGSEWEYFDKISEYLAYPHSNSLVLDSESSPHICYYAVQYGYCFLKYAILNGTVWNITDIDYGDVGFAISNSIDIDSLDNPHVVYTTDYYTCQIKYAKFNGCNWEKETVDDTPNSTAEDVDFALDSNDYPHIAYYEGFDEDNGILRYARWNGYEWGKEIVDDSAHVGAYVSLTLDSFGNPHISYVRRQEGSSWWYGNIKYAYKDEQNWVTENVTTGDTVGWGTSIALDSNGNPYIAFINGTPGNIALVFVSRINGSWESEIVASGGSSYPSLVLDLNDKPDISYCDYKSGNLNYATTVKLNCSPDAPNIDGPPSGKPFVEYEYTFNSKDPEGEPIMYFVDWGDNDTEWTEYCDSGDMVILKHTWNENGMYTIIAKAKDINDMESNWAYFDVEIPRTRASSYQWYEWLFERFLLLERLMNLLR